MSSIPPDRASLLGDELTRAIDAYANNPTKETLSDFCAALIGRCASMAASAVMGLHDRIDAIERRRDGE